jgi:hypothetical protein
VTTLAAALPAAGRRVPIAGRTFVSPGFDFLFIAGGWSLAVLPLLALSGGLSATAQQYSWLPVLVLLAASTHVGASTVRLYTKPGSLHDYPFLTMVFPLLTVVALTAAVAWPDAVGRHVQALYLTWTPYHYAAQSYGLAVMYCYRSGCSLDATDKKLLRLTCLVPFVLAFLRSRGSGIEWLVPASVLEQPALGYGRHLLVQALLGLTLAAPGALFLRLGRPGKAGMPLISLLTIFTNGIWWLVLQYGNAFVWATIFHGVQYLCISAIFHVKEQAQQPSNRRGWPYHVLRFYLLSAILAYCLFHVWPVAYLLAGFGWAEAMFLTTAVLSLHHVVVDAYIWRLRRDRNYRVVTADAHPA